MRELSIACVFILFATDAIAQHTHESPDTTRRIADVEISADVKPKIETDMKMAVSVDEFLASSEQISFIKRGSYAW